MILPNKTDKHLAMCFWAVILSVFGQRCDNLFTNKTIGCILAVERDIILM